MRTNQSSHIFTFTFKLLTLLAFYAYSYITVLKCTCVFFQSINEVKWLSQIKGMGDLSSILRLLNLFDCHVCHQDVIVDETSCPQHYFQLIFTWLTHTEWCKLLLFTKIFAWITSVSSFVRSRHAYMALYVRTPRLSVNSGTDVARSGTRGRQTSIPGLSLAFLDGWQLYCDLLQYHKVESRHRRQKNALPRLAVEELIVGRCLCFILSSTKFVWIPS